MTSLADRPENPVVGRAVAHDSASEHATGEALYTDDLIHRSQNVLHAWPVQAPHARARITSLDAAPALEVPGVARVLTAEDVPGTNDSGIKGDEPLFPCEVMFHGQAVCWVLGETLESARLGAEAVTVEYEPLESIVTLAEAIAAGSFQGGQPTVSRGDAEAGLTGAPHRFSGAFEFGGQEHFSLATHASLAHGDACWVCTTTT